jgi:hypothetical protein
MNKPTGKTMKVYLLLLAALLAGCDEIQQTKAAPPETTKPATVTKPPDLTPLGLFVPLPEASGVGGSSMACHALFWPLIPSADSYPRFGIFHFSQPNDWQKALQDIQPCIYLRYTYLQ